MIISTFCEEFLYDWISDKNFYSRALLQVDVMIEKKVLLDKVSLLDMYFMSRVY